MHQNLILKNGLKFKINLAVHIIQAKQMRFKKSMVRSDLCDYSDAYINVK